MYEKRIAEGQGGGWARKKINKKKQREQEPLINGSEDREGDDFRKRGHSFCCYRNAHTHIFCELRCECLFLLVTTCSFFFFFLINVGGYSSAVIRTDTSQQDGSWLKSHS